jgi:DnaJ-class molecular chaperone
MSNRFEKGPERGPEREKPCPECQGRGHDKDGKTCARCKGRGSVLSY